MSERDFTLYLKDNDEEK